MECDSVELASYLYSELQGAELERSANILNLSFVPDDMTFDEECRLCLAILSFDSQAHWVTICQTETKPTLPIKTQLTDRSTLRRM